MPGMATDESSRISDGISPSLDFPGATALGKNALIAARILRAAETGDKTSQVIAALHYADGTGLEKNYALAYKWAHLAAIHGERTGDLLLDLFLRKITFNQILEGRNAAVFYAEGEFAQIKSIAEAGNERAQIHMGACHELGCGCASDYVKAADWYLKAASHNNADARTFLGICHFKGIGVRRDTTEAARLFEKAAAQNHAAAAVLLQSCDAGKTGGAIDRPENCPESIQSYLKAAEQGEIAAQYYLGCFYAKGKGVAQNWTLAASWWRKAADQGDIHSQKQLASFYENGKGVEQDYAQAAAWYRKAAQQGLADAQFSLGRFHALGLGVSKDAAAAVCWWKQAAETGSADAQFNLAESYYHGDGIAQDFAEAAKWYFRSAENGDANAQCNLGVCHNKGRGVVQDFAIAVHWWRQAADQGHEDAQYYLASSYFLGRGVEKDLAEAYAWSHIAATSGKTNLAAGRDAIKSALRPNEIEDGKRRERQYKVKIKPAC